MNSQPAPSFPRMVVLPAPAGPAMAVNRWSKHNAGWQGGHGPSCAAFAAVNCALAMGLPGADKLDPDAVFDAACEIDGIDDKINDVHGTLLQAAMQVACVMLPGNKLFTVVRPGDLAVWVAKHGPVAVGFPHYYTRIGFLGTVARRLPERFAPGHALCLVGYDPRKWVGWGVAPCFLVQDSVVRGKWWMRESDLRNDLRIACAFFVID